MSDAASNEQVISARPDRTGSRLFELPNTSVGRWSAGITVVFVLVIGLKLASLPVPVPTMGAFALEFVGGALALVAVIGKHERSWVLWFAIALFVLALAWTVAEIAYPH